MTMTFTECEYPAKSYLVLSGGTAPGMCVTFPESLAAPFSRFFMLGLGLERLRQILNMFWLGTEQQVI
jgi:hypothetical protein